MSGLWGEWNRSLAMTIILHTALSDAIRFPMCKASVVSYWITFKLTEVGSAASKTFNKPQSTAELYSQQNIMKKGKSLATIKQAKEKCTPGLFWAIKLYLSKYRRCFLMWKPVHATWLMTSKVFSRPFTVDLDNGWSVGGIHFTQFLMSVLEDL